MVATITNTIWLGSVYTIVALGLGLTYGVMNLIDVANPAFVVLGAYLGLTASRQLGIDPILFLIVTVPLIGCLGAVIQRVMLKGLERRALTDSTLILFGLAMVLENCIAFSWSADFQTIRTSYTDSTVKILGVNVPIVHLITFGLAVVTVGGLFLLLKKTFLGKAIYAVNMNREAALLLGINVERIDSLTYGIGTAIATIAGVMIGLSFVFYPSVVISWIIVAFAITVVGGKGSLLGTLVAALLIASVENLTMSFFSAGWVSLVAYAFLTLTLVVKPAGLFSSGR
jgi:branched-chain amino acid transport system permease protein